MLNILTRIKTTTLLLGDILVLYFALWLTLLVRYQKSVSTGLWNEHWLPFSVVFLMWIIIFFINKLYDLSTAKNNIQFYTLILNSIIWCALVGTVFFYIATTGISPKTVLVLDIVIFTLLFVVWRRLFNKAIINQKLDRKSVV